MDAVAGIEARVVRHVNLVTGDREFPDDLREQIQGIIAVCGVTTPEGLPPTTQMTQTNRTRNDDAVVNTDTEAILDNAPELEDRFIVIPNVL